MKYFTLGLFYILTATYLKAQVPTDQDCFGAIPVCNSIYNQPNSYIGEGNYGNEINSIASCLHSGEKNDVWYVFTVQQSGILNFSITPVNMDQDYDWSVFNLTNASCTDIYDMGSLEVSCNYSSEPGVTGPNNLGGFQNESTIFVNAGETYVINVSNFEEVDQEGYSLNFSASTAVIFDNIPPTMTSATSALNGTNTVNVGFSENITCASVTPDDFLVVGPGGETYTVVSITGQACDIGGPAENDFILTVSPLLNSCGNYTVYLVNPVVDNCGNLTPLDTFSITGPSLPTYTLTSTPNTSCDTINSPNGTAAIQFATPLTDPYTVRWSYNNLTTDAITGVRPGVHTMILSVGNICKDTQEVYVGRNLIYPILNLTISPSSCNTNAGVAQVNPSNGTAPYTIDWSNGASTNNVNNLPAGSNTVSVIDDLNCKTDTSFSISLPPQVSATTTMLPNTSCDSVNNSNGTAKVVVQGLNAGEYTVIWNYQSLSTTTITDVPPGNYTVIVVSNSDNTCRDTSTIRITSTLDLPRISAITSQNANCGSNNGSSTITIAGGTAPYQINWSNGQTNTTTATNLTTTDYTVLVTDLNYCTADTSITITALGFQLQVTPTANTSCDIVLNPNGAALLTVTGLQAGTYTTSWSYQNQSGLQVSSIPPGNQYVIVAPEVGNNCLQADTIFFTVLDNSIPITTNFTYTNPVCGNDNGEAHINILTGTPAYNIVWSNGQNADLQNALNLGVGQYTVQVIDANNCAFDSSFRLSDSSGFNLTITTTPDTCGTTNSGTAAVVATPILDPSMVFTYLWNNGQTGTTIQNLDNGTYNVTVSNNYGCLNTISGIVPILTQNPVAAFEPSTLTPTTLFPSVNFVDFSTNAASLAWSLGDGTTSTATTFTHQYTAVGDYRVVLIVEDIYGCIDSVSTIISYDYYTTIYIPNTFSPNEDGINEIFLPVGIDWDSTAYSLEIFDRWGEKLFTSMDPAIGWNGSKNNTGSVLQDAVYNYKVMLKGKDKDYRYLSGKVMLLR